ncbi:MAG TPA: helix-turn-helix domain-containing protein [Candidatus Limnocylindrales bacterium]|nr:helix-turn-helix domain-containing protein [Candidatus Limnocylindrales bacterium]
MPKRKRDVLSLEAVRRNREQLGRLGADVRAGRKRRRLTQQRLADLVGLSRSAVSAIERGLGGGHTLDAWQRVAVALNRPLRLDLARDPLDAPADAGHLGVQELVLGAARRAGWSGSFELATRPAEPWRSADVGLVDRRRRLLVLVECWNSIGDVGASARSTNRKLAEARGLPAGRGGEARVSGCWVVRATARNRRLVATYPELFAARFPGSSRGWLEALTVGAEPPIEPGLVWASVEGSRLYPWRRRL